MCNNNGQSVGRSAHFYVCLFLATFVKCGTNNGRKFYPYPPSSHSPATRNLSLCVICTHYLHFAQSKNFQLKMTSPLLLIPFHPILTYVFLTLMIICCYRLKGTKCIRIKLLVNARFIFSELSQSTETRAATSRISTSRNFSPAQIFKPKPDTLRM